MRKAMVKVSREGGRPLPLRPYLCDTFACRLRGLTFRRWIGEDEGLLFVEPVGSRLGTAIHMVFVFFAIGVVWLDGNGTVVDKVVARPFRPYYAPRGPAKCFLEGPPALVGWVALGERLRIELEDGSPVCVA